MEIETIPNEAQKKKTGGKNEQKSQWLLEQCQAYIQIIEILEVRVGQKLLEEIVDKNFQLWWQL